MILPIGNICNCDMNDDTRFLQDGGNITDSAVLPVSQLFIGDTGGHREEGFYTLGPLECYSSTSHRHCPPFQLSVGNASNKTQPNFLGSFGEDGA